MKEVQTPKQKLSQRHKDAQDRLRKISSKVIGKCANRNTTATAIYNHVGAKLFVTAQTVINYIGGSAKDGFMTEAIAEEFENIELNK